MLSLPQLIHSANSTYAVFQATYLLLCKMSKSTEKPPFIRPDAHLVQDHEHSEAPNPTQKSRLCIWPLLVYGLSLVPLYIPLVNYIITWPHRKVPYAHGDMPFAKFLLTITSFFLVPYFLIPLLCLFVCIPLADHLSAKLYLLGTASPVTDWVSRTLIQVDNT